VHFHVARQLVCVEILGVKEGKRERDTPLDRKIFTMLVDWWVEVVGGFGLEFPAPPARPFPQNA